MALLSTQEAAERIGVTRRWILALIKAEKLKATRVGKLWVVDPADLEAVRNLPVGRPRSGVPRDATAESKRKGRKP